jgi:type VI secretion system secreted protein VgrG
VAYTQENRLIAIATPLGNDVLLLGGFHGKEGLSNLFSFELDMVSENHNIPFEEIIGQNVTLSVVLASGASRVFNGIISSFAQGRGGGEMEGENLRFSTYRAVMVPWLWLLTRTADSRIFQKLSVPEIVEKVFGEKGFADFKMQLQGSYEKRDYCVQYRETDFNFISRLLEEEGIHYFFEHEEGKHTLVLADSPQANAPCPGQEIARYQMSAGGWLEEDVIAGLERSQEIRPAKHTLNDFNFEAPNTDLTVNVPTRLTLGPGEREIYDYPGLFTKKEAGDRLARIRMEEDEARVTTVVGQSNCRAFTSGYRFRLAFFYRGDMNNKEYVLTSLEHQAEQAWEDNAELAYHNRFTCIPYEVPYRPLRTTSRPVVHGTQTAIVVGPAGEEIHTDEHGRVKVQFHWDREGKKDENSSCWIRVSQVWAGAGWGGICIPRIGQEVIVDFLEGDPDRPIITGRVYHGVNKPPYELPQGKVISGLKSDSTPGGGGYNEMSMDDTKGTEKITIHAQYDMNTTVEHDQTNTVHHDFTETIKNNATISITEGVYSHDVQTGTATYHVKDDISEDYDANQTTTVNKTIAITSEASNIVVTAATTIELRVGASRIYMDAAGNISITGINIAVNGAESVSTAGHAIRSTAGNEHEIKGAIVKSEGSATNTVKGGMVMLNP